MLVFFSTMSIPFMSATVCPWFWCFWLLWWGLIIYCCYELLHCCYLVCQYNQCICNVITVDCSCYIGLCYLKYLLLLLSDAIYNVLKWVTCCNVVLCLNLVHIIITALYLPWSTIVTASFISLCAVWKILKAFPCFWFIGRLCHLQISLFNTVVLASSVIRKKYYHQLVSCLLLHKTGHTSFVQ